MGKRGKTKFYANVKRRKSSGMAAKVAVCALAAVALVAGAWFGIGWTLRRLGEICDEQCRVENTADKVEVATGMLIPRETVMYAFNLTNGVNIATLDFAAMRTNFLGLVTSVRDVRIEKHLPDRVKIDVMERIPVARMMTMVSREGAARVTDEDGYVFNYPRRDLIVSLPVVRDPTARMTRQGERLGGMAAAAARLVKYVHAFHRELGVVDINTSGQDYLEATLASGAVARIAWAGMTERDPVPAAAVASMERQVDRLTKAIESGLVPNAAIWNATDYADKGFVTGNDPSRMD